MIVEHPGRAGATLRAAARFESAITGSSQQASRRACSHWPSNGRRCLGGSCFGGLDPCTCRIDRGFAEEELLLRTPLPARWPSICAEQAGVLRTCVSVSRDNVLGRGLRFKKPGPVPHMCFVYSHTLNASMRCCYHEQVRQ